ncbi:hypothetical protein [Nocardioides jishulii]|uniref:Uncharacterized protein n=1 Tax=Nocardioides jishulii TaxID=2575440 RepID=A0A4U2YVY8_9ACTN|nr:hypothetical protein [Nocardioides jishulii]QCX28793.1 hypothetical protein FCL41_15595 [Nocardioides jishulii]TKI64311.1 hypothetical protein FC770_03975 [Nocardioides jishulii]
MTQTPGAMPASETAPDAGATARRRHPLRLAGFGVVLLLLAPIVWFVGAYAYYGHHWSGTTVLDDGEPVAIQVTGGQEYLLWGEGWDLDCTVVDEAGAPVPLRAPTHQWRRNDGALFYEAHAAFVTGDGAVEVTCPKPPPTYEDGMEVEMSRMHVYVEREPWWPPFLDGFFDRSVLAPLITGLVGVGLLVASFVSWRRVRRTAAG